MVEAGGQAGIIDVCASDKLALARAKAVWNGGGWLESDALISVAGRFTKTALFLREHMMPAGISAADFQHAPLEFPAPGYADLRRVGGRVGPGGGFNGTNAAVFSATFHGWSVVIKVMISVNSGLLESTQLRNEFENEFAILKRLPTHPNVVALLRDWTGPVNLAALPHFECEPFSKTLMMALPLYPLSLLQLVTRRRSLARSLAWKEFREVAVGLLRAVSFLQEHGVVHRDIKLDNVMLRQERGEWIPLLIDFGMGLDCEKKKISGFLVPYEDEDHRKGGAWGFLPPEIRLCNPGPGVKLDYSKSDIFAVGATLWSVLAPSTEQRLPFEDRLERTRLDGYIELQELPQAHDLIRGLMCPHLLSAVGGLPVDDDLIKTAALRLTVAEALSLLKSIE
jgi:serine/threonine protein kinase